MQNFFDEKYVASFKEDYFFAGVDEVGRGPLAGPVVSSCVYFEVKKDANFREALDFLLHFEINDSKKLSPKKREWIYSRFFLDQVIEKGQVYVIPIIEGIQAKIAVSEVSSEEIDEINILKASLKAMRDAFFLCHRHKKNVEINSLDFHFKTGIVLIDGNIVPTGLESYAKAIVKGDSKSQVIGLASIVAKVYRDNLMKQLSLKFPGYGLEKHAGYPTAAHKEAIRILGPSLIHRKSFSGVKECL